MKIVAITQRLSRDEKTLEIRESLDVNWAKLFKSVNLLPLILPINCDFRKYLNTIKISGIVLTGGNDLSSLTKDRLSAMRDKRERELIKFSIKQNIPILGICRGMQIIAEYFGSSVIRVSEHVGCPHKLVINKKSKFYNDLISYKKVNSYHNYAVHNASKDILISAWSDDGVIEAIEHRRYKIFGHMWHPERGRCFRKLEIETLGYFFNKKEKAG